MDSEEIRFRLLKLIEERPAADQRELSQALGVSLGRTNYCLRALIDKGLVKFNNFRRNPNKIQYRYVITPAGLTEKLHQTAMFLRIKRAEFADLKREIESLSDELQRAASAQES